MASRSASRPRPSIPAMRKPFWAPASRDWAYMGVRSGRPIPGYKLDPHADAMVETLIARRRQQGDHDGACPPAEGRGPIGHFRHDCSSRLAACGRGDQVAEIRQVVQEGHEIVQLPIGKPLRGVVEELVDREGIGLHELARPLGKAAPPAATQPDGQGMSGGPGRVAALLMALRNAEATGETSSPETQRRSSAVVWKKRWTP